MALGMMRDPKFPVDPAREAKMIVIGFDSNATMAMLTAFF